VLARLDKLEAGDAEFEELLGTFTGAAREHIEFEETRVWPGLRIALNTERAAELGDQIAEGKKTAPTRPAAGTTARPVKRLNYCRTGRGVTVPDPGRHAISLLRALPETTTVGRRWSADKDSFTSGQEPRGPSLDLSRLSRRFISARPR
jgi:hypothetical protein